MKIRDMRHWFRVCEDVRKNPDKYSKFVTMNIHTMLALYDEISQLKLKVDSLQMEKGDESSTC